MSGDVFWEVFVYEGPSAPDGYGQLLAVLPGWLALSLSPLGNAVGAGSVTLPLDSPVFWQQGYTPDTTPVLAKETLWQCRMSAGGQYVTTGGVPAVFEFLAQSVDRTTVSADETRTVTVSGPGTGQCLNWGMAMPFGWQPGPGGFTGVTGAIQDQFSEQDPVTGAYALDTVLWNASTPGACSIPSQQVSYTQPFQPSGVNYPVGTAWYDSSAGGAEFVWDGLLWVPAAGYSSAAGTGGGSCRVLLLPGGGYLGGGSFCFTNSSFSASVTPAQPVTPGAPGTPLDGDAANGSDVNQLVVRCAGGTGYAMIALGYAEFYCQYADAAGTVSTHLIGPGEVGGTGAYDPGWAQYWRVSCDLVPASPLSAPLTATGTGGNRLIRFWTSGDGVSWTLQWAVQPPQAWDPSLVDVYLGGTYDTAGEYGAYLTVGSLNGEISAGPDSGPVYVGQPAMAVVADQLARMKARGTVPFIAPSFSAAEDSNGTAWGDSWSVQVPAGTDWLTGVANYAGSVDASWVMQPGYVLYAALEPGRRLESSVVFHEGEVQQLGRTWTRDQVYNVAAAADGAGMIWTQTSPASAAKWGQRETWVSAGGTLTPQSAAATAQAAVGQWDDQADARVIQVPPNQPGKTVFRDFALFDWIGLERGDFAVTDAVQVIGITVNVDQDGNEVHELVLQTYRQVLAQWFAYLLGKFGGQAASTLGALAPGSAAGSAFTLATGPGLAVTPVQLGGAGSSAASAMSVVPSLAAAPEVVAASVPGSSSGVVPGSLLQGGTVSQSALSFEVSAGGTDVYFGPSAPLPPVAAGSLWYNTAAGGQLSVYDGTQWALQLFGTAAIAPKSVTAALIAANTVTAGQIAANTITAGQIAANTITAAQIQGGTITAGLLAAGIVVAGIIDGTTVTGAKLVADGGAGEFLAYGSSPALGDLVASVSPARGGDAYGNDYLSGVLVYSGGNYNAGGAYAGLQISGPYDAPGVFLQPAGMAHLGTVPWIGCAGISAGAGTESTLLVLSSGKETPGGGVQQADAAIQLYSAAANNSLPAEIIFEFGGQVGFVFTSAGSATFINGLDAASINTSGIGEFQGGIEGGTGGSKFTVDVNGQITGQDGIHTAQLGRFDGGVNVSGVTIVNAAGQIQGGALAGSAINAASITTSGAGEFNAGVQTIGIYTPGDDIGALYAGTYASQPGAAIAYWDTTGFHVSAALWGAAGVLTIGDKVTFVTGATSIHCAPGGGEFQDGIGVGGYATNAPFFVAASGQIYSQNGIHTAGIGEFDGGLAAGTGGSQFTVAASGQITGQAGIHCADYGQFGQGLIIPGGTISSVASGTSPCTVGSASTLPYLNSTGKAGTDMATIASISNIVNEIRSSLMGAGIMA